MARKFMCVCLGLLALALAFHLGSRAVSATAKPIPIGIIDSQEPLPAISHGRALFVVTDTGDCYYKNLYSGKEPTGWQYFGNIHDAEK
jgi:hypothetical protein